jgi:hypothetical protein
MLTPHLTLDSTPVQTAGQTKHSNMFLIPHEPFTSADRNAVIVCPNPTRGMDKTVFLFLVILSCAGEDSEGSILLGIYKNGVNPEKWKPYGTTARSAAEGLPYVIGTKQLTRENRCCRN